MVELLTFKMRKGLSDGMLGGRGSEGDGRGQG